jgi:hypothetical protein
LKYNWHCIYDNQLYTQDDFAKLPSKSAKLQPPVEGPSKTLYSLVSLTRDLNPVQQPGFLLVDSRGTKLTFMSPQFLVLKKLLWEYDLAELLKNMLDLVRQNSHFEFLEYFPRFTQLYEKVRKNSNSHNFFSGLGVLFGLLKAPGGNLFGIERQRKTSFRNFRELFRWRVAVQAFSFARRASGRCSPLLC